VNSTTYEVPHCGAFSTGEGEMRKVNGVGRRRTQFLDDLRN